MVGRARDRVRILTRSTKQKEADRFSFGGSYRLVGGPGVDGDDGGTRLRWWWMLLRRSRDPCEDLIGADSDLTIDWALVCIELVTAMERCTARRRGSCSETKTAEANSARRR